MLQIKIKEITESHNIQKTKPIKSINNFAFKKLMCMTSFMKSQF